MNIKLKRFQTILLIILMILTFTSVQGERPKKVYGKISLNTIGLENNDRLVIPLRNFKIEILELNVDKRKRKKAGEVLFETYPDSNGYYSFKYVPEETYYLRVSHIQLKEAKYSDEIIEEREISVKYNKKGKHRLAPISVLILKKLGNDDESNVLK